MAEARAHPACFGARLTGAGFGGCAVALVARDETAAFIDHVRRGYERRTGRRTDTFATRPAAGAYIEV